MRSNEQIRGTGALIILSCIQNGIDHGLCDDVVLTKVSRGIGSLKFFLSSCDIEINVNGVQIIIQPNRSDVIRRNLAFISVVSAITQHDCSCQLFIEHQAVDVVQVYHIVEIGDVNDIISMQRTLYVHSLRVCSSANQLEVASLLLLFSLSIAFSLKSIDVTDIYLASSDSGNRTLMNFVHYRCDPTLIVSNQLRCTRTYILVFREQKCYIAISCLSKSACKSIMLKCILISIDLQCGLECSYLACLCQLKDFLLVCVRQKALIIALVSVKNVVFHIVISSFRFIILFFRIFFVYEFSHHGENGCLLFLVHGFKNVFDSLNLIVFFLSTI